MPDEISEKTAAELFNDIPAPRTTRERILFAALDLFHSEGFHAVGLDRILAAVGVTKTTFYNHFESRDALIEEAIKTRDAWDAKAFEQRLRVHGGYKPRDLLLGMFDVLDEWFTHPDYRGCIFLHACAEFPAPTDPINQAAAAHYAVSQETIGEIAEAAGIAEPRAFAQRWSLLLQGALTHRMIANDDHAAKVARAVAEVLLEHALPST